MTGVGGLAKPGRWPLDCPTMRPNTGPLRPFTSRVAASRKSPEKDFGRKSVNAVS
jgi:hypothetical protein